MTTEMKQATCEERIDAHLKGRVSDFTDLLTKLDPPEIELEDDDAQIAAEEAQEKEREEAEEELSNMGLSLKIRRTVVWVLSTGGPHDEFQFEVDEDGELSGRIRYRFKDWWDGAERYLDGDEYDTMAEIYAQCLQPYVEAQG